MANPFDYVEAVSYSKKNLFEDPQAEKEYNPFIVNRALSYHADSVFWVNEMNRYADLPKKWQYDYLLHTLVKKKRFAKWAKQDISETLDLISETYKYSLRKAIDVLPLLNEQQLEELKNKNNKGGKQ